MSEPRSITVVVPVHDPTAVDAQNLEAVLTALGTAGPDAIIVCEQVADEPSSILSDVLGRFGSAQHLVVESTRPLIEAGRLVNRALAGADTDLVWIHEPDLYLPFEEILPGVRRSPSVAVKPYASFVKLSERASRRFLQNPKFTPELFVDKTPLGENVGKGSYVVEREALLALGGLSEAFAGPADSGFELFRRFKKYFADVDTSCEARGVKLFAAPRPGEPTLRSSNRGLRERLARRIEEDVEGYLARHLDSSIEPKLPALAELSRQRRRELAVRPTCPTPPPPVPRTLGGEIWGVTTFFNPHGYANKKQNYDRFRAGLADVGLRLLTVELVFDDREPELGPADAESLVRVRDGDWLWQKERLLNIAFRRLPASCDKVVWLDGDVLFSSGDWPKRTAAALERWVMVQPFALSVRLEPDETRVDVDDLPVGSAEHEVLHGIAYGVSRKGYESLSGYLTHGHSGYAWAGRRDVLERHGLYDANILGNADLNIAHAMFGGRRYLRTDRFSEKASNHLKRWADRFYEDVRGSVGYVDGVLYHLWHGSKQDRLYDRRLRVLIDNDFDPEADLTCDEGGAYRWSSDKPTLHAWCRDYFALRREDQLPEQTASAS